MYRYRFWTEVELLLYQVKAEVGVCSDLVDGAFLLPVPVSPTLASRGSNPPPCIQSSKCCQYNHTDPCAPHLAVFFCRKILSQKIWCYVIGFVRSISLNREKNNLSFLSWCLCCSHSVPVCMSAFTALFQKNTLLSLSSRQSQLGCSVLKHTGQWADPQLSGFIINPVLVGHKINLLTGLICCPTILHPLFSERQRTEVQINEKNNYTVLYFSKDSQLWGKSSKYD